MSKNHQFSSLTGSTVKRYRKEVIHALAGLRLNPFKPEDANMEYVIETPQHLFDLDTKKRTGYDDNAEVIELYSPHEVTVFERLNSRFINDGELVEYTADETTPTTTAFTDRYIREKLAACDTVKDVAAWVETITVVKQLKRIKDVALDSDISVPMLKVITKRYEQINAESTT